MAASSSDTHKAQDSQAPDSSGASSAKSPHKVSSSSSGVNHYQHKDDNEESSSGLVYSREQSFTGPMPPPQVLAQYDEVIPGFASQI